MKLFDISNPDQPLVAGQYYTNFQTDDLFIKGNYAFIAHDSGFVALDISVPSLPVLFGEYIKTAGKHLVAASDDYIFLASDGIYYDSLLVLELSDSTDFNVLGRYGEQQDIQDMFYDEDYIYLLTDDALKIIDVANPANPVVVGYYNPEYTANNIHYCNGYIFLSNSIGFTVINAANPLNPVVTGFYIESGGYERLFADSSYVYAYNQNDIFRVVDVTVPALPELSGRYENSSVSDLFVYDDYIYICDNDSLKVLYLEDDEAP